MDWLALFVSTPCGFYFPLRQSSSQRNVTRISYGISLTLYIHTLHVPKRIPQAPWVMPCLLRLPTPHFFIFIFSPNEKTRFWVCTPTAACVCLYESQLYWSCVCIYTAVSSEPGAGCETGVSALDAEYLPPSSLSIQAPIAGSQPETQRVFWIQGTSGNLSIHPRVSEGCVWLPGTWCWSLSGKAKRQCPRISGSAASCPSLCEYTVCPPPPSGIPVSPSPCEYKVCPTSIRGTAVSSLCGSAVPMCYLPNADDSCPRYSEFVTGARHPLPLPRHGQRSHLNFLSSAPLPPSLPGTENARKPAGAVGKSRSGGAAQGGLRLPRPCRQGPPACPLPNARAPGRPGTAASATLPGPAQPSRRGRWRQLRLATAPRSRAGCPESRVAPPGGDKRPLPLAALAVGRLARSPCGSGRSRAPGSPSRWASHAVRWCCLVPAARTTARSAAPLAGPPPPLPPS